MPELLCGGAGSGKSALIFEKIGSLAREGKRSLLIVPENMSHTAERRLLEVCGNPVSRYASAVTFSGVVSSILSLAGDEAPSLDGGGRILAMFRALSEVESGLKHYRGAALKARLVSSMLETAEELIFAGVTPEKLNEAASGEEMSDKIKDVSAVFGAYLTVCSQGSLDPASLLDRAADHIAGTGFFDGVYVFIDDFSGFSGQKYAFLERVLERCADMTVSVLHNGDDTVFSEQGKMRDRFIAMGRRCGKPFAVRRLSAKAQDKPAELLKCSEVFDVKAKPLVSGRERPSLLKALCGGDFCPVSVCVAADPAEESELCAALIRGLTLCRGARLRDVAVVSGDPEKYGRLLERDFDKYGVPVFFSRNENVLKKPVLAAALGPLEALRDGMRPDPVLSYIKSGFVPLSDDEISRLENYVLLWNVRGNAWFSPFKKATSGFERPFKDEEERLAGIEKSRAAAVANIELLRSLLKDRRTCGDYVSAFNAYLEQSRLADLISERAVKLSSLGMEQEAAEHAQLFGILQNALTQTDGVLHDAPATLDEFYSLLVMILSQYDVSSIPSSLDAVQASSFTALSPAGVKHLIILGAVDGLLPPDVPHKSILSDAERAALEGEGISLPTDEDKAFEQQSDVYRVLSSPCETLTVFRPLSSNGGECSESYVLKSLLRLIPEAEKGVTQSAEVLDLLRLTAPKPLSELACSCLSNETPASLAALTRFKKKRPELIEELREYSSAKSASIKNRESLMALYEKKLSLSPSSLERAGNCPFAFFASYGIRAKERPEYGISALHVGTLIHSTVEHSIKELSAKGGDVRAVARRHFDTALSNQLRDADSARMKTVLSRIRESAELIVSDVWEEIENSDFKPKYFEFSFKNGGDAPPLTWEDRGVTCVLTGTADRIDYCGDRFKVVDYKTGTKKFGLADLVNGHNLQLFLYSALLQNAGMGECAADLYIPARSEYLSVGEGETAESVRRDDLKRRGLIRSEADILEALEHGAGRNSARWLPVGSSAERDRFLAVGDYCVKKAKELASVIIDGDVSAAPNGKDACEYCSMKLACRFDERDVRYAVKRLYSARFNQALDKITGEEAE